MEHTVQIKELQANADELTIHVVSDSSTKETFWCFLAKPEQLDTGNEIYANSNARLTIAGGSSPEASFTIPVQFSLAAKSVNRPIGLGVKVSTRQSENVELEESWKATFYTSDEHQAPDLVEIGDPASENTINYASSPFSPDNVIKNDWYPTQSYGMKTAAGFVGLTWDARPNKTVKIEPLVEFYITVAEYSAGTLANLTTVSTDAAKVKLKDFRGGAVTVTYTSTGEWVVTPGKVKQMAIA